MRRRDFIFGLCGAFALAQAAHAEEKATPIVGFLRSTAAAPFRHLVTAFREGLKEEGFVEGENVRVEYRYADGHRDRLPALAAGLVRDEVSVIVGNSLAAEAAKRVTSTVPIVFVTSDDPVKRGLVAEFARPRGNATGFTFFGGGQLAAKRMEILRDLVPQTDVVGLLLDPNWPASRVDLAETQAAARTLNRRLVPAEAATRAELGPAFAALEQSGVGALIVGGAPSFSSQRAALIELSARAGLPTIYDLRDFVVEGGLASYSGSFKHAYRQAGIYAGKILRGASAADLPVQQPTRFELVINLKTAKSLGLTVPPSLLARADEVIE